MNNYLELRKININEHCEKKGRFTYLSWAWAVDQLLQLDPSATWHYDQPMAFGDTLMVFCTVRAFGKEMTAQLPVMNNQNKAMSNPDAFAVNTAMQRCLAKAIALHGLGLYIYAGEDLPNDDVEVKHAITPQQIATIDMLIEQTDTNLDKFLEFFKKPSIAHFDRQQATNAISILEKKAANVSQ